MYPLWNFFLERRAFTILIMVALLLSGGWALIAMPKESYPEVEVPIGIVSTVLPGATAADVERLVTDKLEPSVRNVPGIDKVTSSSRQGVSVITAQFLANADIETAIQDLRNAVEGAKRELPSDAEAPTVTKVDFQNEPILMIGIGSDLAPETLTQLGEDLKDDLISLPGVSNVSVSGTRAREVSIIIHKDALASHGLSVGQVVGALGGANASAPSGAVTIDGIEYPVQFKGDITNVEDIANTPIKTQTGEIRVRDIADVIDGFEKTSTISRLALQGEEATFAMTLNVYKSAGGNILSVTESVKDRLVELEDSLLRGSDAIIVYDAGEEVRKSISELTEAGVVTVTLVMLVLFITIGLREALVSALSIPFSFTIAFLGMWATGNTINFISLFALIIAIGILVDSGIVVVEAIHTNRENGMEKVDAAKKAIRQYSWPLIAGTMTTVAVFVPLFFLSGIIGEFVQGIPFTIIVVLLASIVVSLGFVPLLALWILKHEESSFAIYREKLWVTIAEWYRKKMLWLFERRKAQRIFFIFLTLSFVAAIALPVTGLLKVSMFPAADQDFIYVEIELPQASTLGQTDKVAREVEHVLAGNQFVSSYLTTIGAPSVFNQNPGGSSGKLANITVNLDTGRDSKDTSIKIAEALRRDLAPIQGGKITVTEASGGPPSGAPIVAKIWSDDTASLALMTEKVERLIENTEGTRGISSSLSNDGTELQINVDRSKAQEYGLSAADVALALRAAIAGVEATKVRVEGDDLEVRVTFDLNPNYVQPEETTIANADAIARIPIATQRGTVALGSLITITANRTSATIEHENGMRIGTVSAYVKEDANAVEITNAIRAEVEKLELPQGTRITFGGEDEEIQRTFTEMLIALVAGMIFMFAILVLEFNAFRTTLRLLLAIPLSLTGVLFGLFIMGQPLSFTAFLGIIALGGVLINHGILLLDVLYKLHKEYTGTDARQLVLDASTVRIRPIILTTITTVIGMIPLTLVSAMWAPLAFTIAFGLLYGTLLTLVLIPLLSFRRMTKEFARRLVTQK